MRFELCPWPFSSSMGAMLRTIERGRLMLACSPLPLTSMCSQRSAAAARCAVPTRPAASSAMPNSFLPFIVVLPWIEPAWSGFREPDESGRGNVSQLHAFELVDALADEIEAALPEGAV